MQLYDTTLEQRFLSALIKYPQEYLEIQSLFSEDDIYSKESVLHRTIFTLIKQSVEKGEDVEATILSQRALNLGIKFDEELPVGDYIISLSQRNVAAGSVEKFAKELKKLSIRRKISQTGRDIEEKMKSLPPTTSFSEIVDAADNVYHAQINHFETMGDRPSDLYEKMEEIVEERGNNPIENFGLMGPFKTVNKIYGSLVRPGNIGVICARAKTGKTSLGLLYSTHLVANYDHKVLHLDNGEMSEEELMFRQCAALSGVPLHFIETGKWRKNEVFTKKIRAIWPKVKSLKSKYFYYCVAGMSPEEMTSFAERFYYKQVGRGNSMTICFDYLKTTGQLSNGLTEWQVVGEMVDGFKRLITKKILFNKNPVVGLLTFVQANRSGIVRGKKTENIIDDESVVALSDRISHYCSHLGYLRKKSNEERLEEGEEFGTHKLMFFVARHLGEDAMGHNESVKVDGGLWDNFINLKFDNFMIEDCGDLRDIAHKKQSQANPKTNTDDEPIDF